jgi:predicted transcriptional regulator
MTLNIGGDVLVRKRDIICIMDIDNTSISKKTREFLEKSEKSGKVKYVSFDALPKSFILVSEYDEISVYISPLLSSTLYKRYLSGF